MSQPLLVSLVQGDTWAETEVPGQLVAVPEGTVVRGTTESSVTLGRAPLKAGEDDDGDDDLDHLVGLLPIVYWSPDTKMPEVVYVDVPPPAPFEVGDAHEMWADVRKSKTPIPSSLLAQGRSAAGRIESLSPRALELENVRLALVSAQAILRRWPRTEAVSVEWLPIDVRGGKEDVLYTERHARSGGLHIGGDTVQTLLDRTARRRAETPPWKSSRLEILAEALAAALQARAHETELKELMSQYANRVLQQVASAARPDSRRSDPPLSSWPSQARATYRALIRAFVNLQGNEEESSRAPLCNLWKLYETWVGVKVLRGLADVLGEPDRLSRGTGDDLWEAHWQRADGGSVLLVAQPVFGRKGRRIDPAIPAECVSLTSNLIPDVLLAVTSAPTPSTGVVIFDAKKRTSATSLSRADVAEAGSKYVWGLRWLDATAGSVSSATDTDLDFVVSQVVIVTSSTAPTMHSDASNIEAIELRPLDGCGQLQQRLQDVLHAGGVTADA